MKKCKKIETDTSDELELQINEFLKGLEGDWVIHDTKINYVVTMRDEYHTNSGKKNDYFGYWVCFIFYE